MTKRALVTGAAGFIGSNLTRRLLDDGGWLVDVVDNLSTGRQEHIKDLSGTMKYFYDFADDTILDNIRRGIYDVVFHLAATPRVAYSVEHPAETTDNNLNKTVKLMEACKDNVGRFVFSSSSSVYGNTESLPSSPFLSKNPRSPYALQKAQCEDYIKMFNELYGFDAVCLRYFNVFGPNAYGDSPYSTAVAAWCHAVKDGRPLRSDGDGEQSRDMCYVDNVVDANILAANYEGDLTGQVLNVGCGDRTTNNEVLEYFKNTFPGIEVEHAPERPGDVKHTQADIYETTKLLGYEPKVKFWDGLEKTIRWWDI